jgi:hypothetical protein
MRLLHLPFIRSVTSVASPQGSGARPTFLMASLLVNACRVEFCVRSNKPGAMNLRRFQKPTPILRTGLALLKHSRATARVKHDASLRVLVNGAMVSIAAFRDRVFVGKVNPPD